jgi:hypothetical protein
VGDAPRAPHQRVVQPAEGTPVPTLPGQQRADEDTDGPHCAQEKQRKDGDPLPSTSGGHRAYRSGRRPTKVVLLNVDAENPGATALYERVGMRIVKRWDVWERSSGRSPLLRAHRTW